MIKIWITLNNFLFYFNEVNIKPFTKTTQPNKIWEVIYMGFQFLSCDRKINLEDLG